MPEGQQQPEEWLLASTSHALTFDVLGAMLPPEVGRESSAEFAARLEIVRLSDPGGASGGDPGRG